VSTEQKEEKIKTDRIRANERIERELKPVLERIFANAKIEAHHGGQGNTYLVLEFRDGTDYLQLTVIREMMGEYRWNYRPVIRMNMNSSMDYTQEGYFKKTWGGKRLKTDILSEKWDDQKIVKLIQQATDWFNSMIDHRKANERYQQEEKERLNGLKDELNGLTGLEWHANSRDRKLSHGSFTVTPINNSLEKVHLQLGSAVSAETAKKIIELVKGDN
jgi:excinuclease UvrABC ATPase subunit